MSRACSQTAEDAMREEIKGQIEDGLKEQPPSL